MHTLTDSMTEYITINLKQVNEVVNAALPSKSRIGTHDISSIFEVKGAAIDASAGLRLIPTSAAFKALQSFAPSPQKPTKGNLGSLV
jgi:hypothetical protein